jgi:hypothetical protein
MKNKAYSLLPEDFRKYIMKLDSIQAARVATDMMNERRNNLRNWKIEVYSNDNIDSYTQMLQDNKDEELKFWCYLNKDKSIVITEVHKEGTDGKIGLSCTIDQFGDVGWFDKIESDLKELGWI